MSSTPSKWRTLSRQSSASNVSIPVNTAAEIARQCCTSARAAVPVIHLDSPEAIAVRPSKLEATFKRT